MSLKSRLFNKKKTYYETAFHENENNLKKTWRFVHEITLRKQTNLSIKKISYNDLAVTDS